MNDPARRHGLADDAQRTMQAVALIRLGARLQMLEIECALPRDRLARLYREVRGVPAPKGMLPSSTDWYMTWFANLHASLFHGIYRFLRNEAGCSRVDALIKAYTLYAEHGGAAGLALPLDLTRAWMLVRFVDCGVLDLASCAHCGASFITYRYALRRHRACVACRLPPRAGKRTRIDGAVPCALCDDPPATALSRREGGTSARRARRAGGAGRWPGERDAG
ncbi:MULTISPECIES: FlhC family transcriptional regulator [Burkholderia]|uniref:Flagellar transcriptional regulator FlhC n=1 Tax=Burkholderia paludis TaxID=1506587 RepID=A0A6J5EUG7_9BURK|nr:MULTISPECIES: FlhC family transcriptional regulator [Burkholderia]CAB3770228.1 Flagellar transcriptional regulator FlhC [Burkholderia paludis]VWB92222.1 transcriptional activator FlhC [Burkholderia paludis]